MKFRKKISFSIIVFKILLESLVCSFPHTFSSNPYINEDSWNVIHNPVGETFHFQGNNKSPIQYKSQLKCFPNNNYLKGIENTSNEMVDNEFIIPPEFSSAPNYRDLCNFPEVEYPLSAGETWKPNYWINSYSTDYSNKNVNMDCVNSMLNEQSKVKSTHHYEKKFKPGKISTKSFSDSRNNLASLKTKGFKDFTNVSSHDNKTRNQNENTNIPLDNTKLCNFYTTVSPSDVNSDVCLKDKNVLEHKTNVHNIDDVSYLTLQPEVLLYSEIFKKEIESVLKTTADNIISTNLESSKNNSPCNFDLNETLNDNWVLNLTLINDIAEEFDKEMTLKIKSVADSIRNKIDLTKYISQKTEQNKNSLKTDILCEENLTSTTPDPKLTEVCIEMKTSDFKLDSKEATCKESDNFKIDNNTCPSVNSLSSSTISGHDITCKNEASDFCKSEANIINEMGKENEISAPDDTEKQNIMQSVSDNSNQEISLEEDFTTDSYPENNDWSYALSTVAPQISNDDIMWRDTKVIEPDKSLAYPDELDQYFILSSD